MTKLEEPMKVDEMIRRNEMTLEEMMKARDAKEALAREVYDTALDAYIAERDRVWAEYKDAKKEIKND